ncbi:toxin-antitoxin system HicB family antitoxin [Gluconobacter sphaericus]|uniref:Arc family DNA-binding protein n=1 Tax=Gluconobacter sphaericus TaxID=574987 RepID=UPI001924B92B|nr:toxin-antitoxin system HicB family antitoxin [Gluconobacter sphaericus]QQX91346.1 toxin-antitoxin system HicB family antitoxin [Gluconobacter sphaericus]
MDEDQTLRFSLRVPRELHERLTSSANESNASLNAEMLRLLEKGLAGEIKQAPDRTALEQLFPPQLIWRISRFKDNAGLPSNEEAAKRLIKSALDERESTKDILDKLNQMFKSERDLRILSREVIAPHAAVENIQYGNGYVWFSTRNNESGAIDKKGKLYFSGDGNAWDYNMDYYNPYENQAPPKKNKENSFGWDSPPSDLDDEIPF